MAISSTETQFSSRKFLIPGNLVAPAIPPAMDDIAGISIDTNAVVILSVLVCAVVCSLGFFCIVKCALRCSRFARTGVDHAGELVNKGVKQKVLKTFPVVKYSDKLILPGLDTACIICLSEFAPEERVRVLPKCNHGFHVHCIDKWLSSHSSCPTCRHCLTKPSRKVANCSEASPPGQ